MIQRAAVLLLVSAGLAFHAARPAAADDRSSIRGEIVRIVNHLVRPLLVAPGDGKAFRLEAKGELGGKAGRVEIAWDGRGRHFVLVDIDGVARASAGFGRGESWIHVPQFDKLFLAEHASPSEPSIAAASPSWKILGERLPALLGVLSIAPLPESIALERAGDGTIRASCETGEGIDFSLPAAGKPLSLRIRAGIEAAVELASWSEVAEAELDARLVRPSPVTVEVVDIRHLRGMLATLADFAAERALLEIAPGAVPSPLAGIPRIDGAAVARFSGSPEEMGRRHGTLLREAIRYNLHRILHGVGLASTVKTGKWFPAELASAWAAQEKHIPERFIREIDACSDAAGVPREWGRATNVFPELFHCSGLAVRGTATQGGRLYHGRVLDYMSEIGFQNTAVVMVFEPADHNAWVSVGYAGLCSTVTAMNEKGLAMGEMGGRGEGYLDGMPMSLLMREVVERFETTADAIAWLKETPRTCEYFYVLSDARSGGMSGLASLARKLAAERGVSDLRVIEPGVAIPELPRPVADAVLMSAGKRYDCLADRVSAKHGALDMQGVWDLMAGGVAMKSNLHTALFAPETLDLWVAQAGPRGEPAYTQPVSRLNLRDLRARVELAAEAPAAASAGASGR